MTASSAIIKKSAGATNAMAVPPKPRMMLAISILTVLAVIGSRPGHADSILTLKSDFIEKYKNNVTIDADFLVDKAPPHEHSAAEDGDMHVAGRADQIGLPTVAEIENAAEARNAMDLVHSAEGTGTPIKLTGVWRIWPEHGGEQEQIQFTPIQKIKSTNPPHVFEVHPVTQISNISLLDKLHPIQGFVTKDADEAFQSYERTKATIKPSADGSSVTITMQMAGFNYAEFLMRLNEREAKVNDGEFVFGTILDKGGDVLVNNRRIAFVKGSPPDLVQQSMRPGECIHLVGIPRVDLALVAWRVAHAAERPEVLTWGMPYELVAVGVYDDFDAIKEACQD